MEQVRRSRCPTSDRAILWGHLLPLGATVQPDGINSVITRRRSSADGAAALRGWPTFRRDAHGEDARAEQAIWDVE
jgi:hypothetical protein